MSTISHFAPQVPGLSNPSTGGLDKSDKSSSAKSEPLVAVRNDAPSTADKAASSDRVSISAGTAARDQAGLPAPVYAEIWKGGVRVAQIDMHGHVTSYSGLVASGGGSGVAGQLLAAQRAVQVAQQIGGEIRTAGEAVDRETLLMRAQLARTYAV